MSDPSDPEKPPEAEDFPEDDNSSEGDLLIDEVDLRDALRGALRPPPGAVAPSLLRGVQKKLRVRSRGKFYGDGWSTASSPRTTYLVTSALMLLLIAIVFFALLPFGSSSVP
jgi:hypothetical protein